MDYKICDIILHRIWTSKFAFSSYYSELEMRYENRGNKFMSRQTFIKLSWCVLYTANIVETATGMRPAKAFAAGKPLQDAGKTGGAFPAHDAAAAAHNGSHGRCSSSIGAAARREDVEYKEAPQLISQLKAGGRPLRCPYGCGDSSTAPIIIADGIVFGVERKKGHTMQSQSLPERVEEPRMGWSFKDRILINKSELRKRIAKFCDVSRHPWKNEPQMSELVRRATQCFTSPSTLHTGKGRQPKALVRMH